MSFLAHPLTSHFPLLLVTLPPPHATLPSAFGHLILIGHMALSMAEDTGSRVRDLFTCWICHFWLCNLSQAAYSL